jgi:NADPH:quinone reductase-like Zn-dependent oxidoreductase
LPLAARFSRHADLDVVSIDQVPLLEPGPGQLRLRVKAAGVNPADWKMIEGLLPTPAPLQFPAGVGFDAAGVVDAVGAGVTGFRIGDEVLGKAATGSFAEYAIALPDGLVAKPKAISWEAAGCINSAGGTAWTLVERLKVTPGDTVLVHAAAGGVGHLAAQFAIARGARVIGTASETNHRRLREYGVEPVVYGEGWAARVRKLSASGVDAVIDASGRGELADSVELASGPDRVLTVATLELGDTGVQFHIGSAGVAEYRHIVPLVARGQVQVFVSRTYPLSETVEALKESKAGHVFGKLVIIPA